jgi:hypothetical protein
VSSNQSFNLYKIKKAIPITDRGGPQGYETSSFPHFLDNLLTDGGEVVSLKRRPPLPSERFLILISVSLIDPQAHSAAGRIRSIEKSNDLIGYRTHDLRLEYKFLVFVGK